MLNYSLLLEHLDAVHLSQIMNDLALDDEQLGKHVTFLNANLLPTHSYDIALLGIRDIRGSELKAIHQDTYNDINVVRKCFYSLYNWYTDIQLLDLGDLKIYDNLEKTYQALQVISEECAQKNVKLIVLGGPHNYVLGQYQGLHKLHPKINFSNIDSFIDINRQEQFEEKNFLKELLLENEQGIQDYNHIAFQSYLTYPKILDQLNKFNFEFYRLGYVKDNPFEIEPQFRSSHLISFDMAAIANINHLYTNFSNGLNGEEACLLMRFCGMANQLNGLGIYGYYSFLDANEKTATLLAQMLWYFMEGIFYKNSEGEFQNTRAYETYFTTFNEIKTVFYQNKTTKRWWMEHHDQKKILPCSYNDYLLISKDEIPERWLKGFNK